LVVVVGDVVHLVIKYYQIDMHHHKTKASKLVEAYYQVHGFNVDGLWIS
jgi:hypothetical protein